MKILGIIIAVMLLIIVGIIILAILKQPKEYKFDYDDEAEDEALEGWKQRVIEQQMYEDGIRNW